jgi:hypothetical protein
MFALAGVLLRSQQPVHSEVDSPTQLATPEPPWPWPPWQEIPSYPGQSPGTRGAIKGRVALTAGSLYTPNFHLPVDFLGLLESGEVHARQTG